MQPIALAARGGHMNVIDALVNDYGVDPNTKVSFSYTLYSYYLRSYLLCKYKIAHVLHNT